MTPVRIEKNKQKSWAWREIRTVTRLRHFAGTAKIAKFVRALHNIKFSVLMTTASYQREACIATLNTNQTCWLCAGWRPLRLKITNADEREQNHWNESTRGFSGLIIRPCTRLLCFPTATKLFCWSLRDYCDEILTTTCHLVNHRVFTRWRTRGPVKWKFRKFDQGRDCPLMLSVHKIIAFASHELPQFQPQMLSLAFAECLTNDPTCNCFANTPAVASPRTLNLN